MCVCASMLQNLVQHKGGLIVVLFPPAAIVIYKLKREREEVSSRDMQMKATCCLFKTTGNRETHQNFSSYDKSPSNLPSPPLLLTVLPWCETLQMDPGKKRVQMLYGPMVLSYAALVCAVISAGMIKIRTVFVSLL